MSGVVEVNSTVGPLAAWYLGVPAGFCVVYGPPTASAFGVFMGLVFRPPTAPYVDGSMAGVLAGGLPMAQHLVSGAYIGAQSTACGPYAAYPPPLSFSGVRAARWPPSAYPPPPPL